MVVLYQYGEGAIVDVNAGRGIPSERVGPDITSQRAEAEKMSAAEIVIIQRTENYGTVRQDRGRGRGLVYDVAGAESVGGGIDTDGSAEGAGVCLRGYA